jgi:hypothetical protein
MGDELRQVRLERANVQGDELAVVLPGQGVDEGIANLTGGSRDQDSLFTNGHMRTP